MKQAALLGMDVKEIGAFEAKTKLSELLEHVARGRIYRITKRGKPVAELRPVSAFTRPQFGADRGRVRIAKDFDKPIPEFKRYR
jgi:prevent-host-death family protein